MKEVGTKEQGESLSDTETRNFGDTFLIDDNIKTNTKYNFNQLDKNQSGED